MYDDSQEVEEDASQIILGIAFDVVEDKDAKKHKMLKMKKNKGDGGKKVQEVKDKKVEKNTDEEVEENKGGGESESSGCSRCRWSRGGCISCLCNHQKFLAHFEKNEEVKKVEEVESESSGTTGKKVEKVVARPKFHKLKRSIYIAEEEEVMPFTSEEDIKDMEEHIIAVRAGKSDEHMKKIRATRDEQLAALRAKKLPRL